MATGESSPVSDAFQTISVNNSPTSEQTDDCSPFCICSCCHISTADTKFTYSAATIYAISAKSVEKTPYRTNYFGNFVDSVWQPPKNLHFTA